MEQLLFLTGTLPILARGGGGFGVAEISRTIGLFEAYEFSTSGTDPTTMGSDQAQPSLEDGGRGDATIGEREIMNVDPHSLDELCGVSGLTDTDDIGDAKFSKFSQVFGKSSGGRAIDDEESRVTMSDDGPRVELSGKGPSLTIPMMPTGRGG